MPRRLLLAAALTAVSVLLSAPPAWAHLASEPAVAAVAAGSTTSTTGSDLPGTTLEAEERDDGNTSAAPWIIGSGLAAAAAVAVGGTILKRRQG